MNLHVFDMDGTLLKGTTASLQIARHLGCAQDLAELEARFAAGRIDTRGFAAAIHELWGSLTPQAVVEVAGASPWLSGMTEVCADIRKRGERSVVITMSPDFFARQLLEFGFDDVAASRFPALPFREPLDPGGILTPKDKVRIVDELRERHGLPRSRCVAYGDSMSDAPLFRHLTKTVAVNADHHLAELATVSYRGDDLTGAYALGRTLLRLPVTRAAARPACLPLPARAVEESGLVPGRNRTRGTCMRALVYHGPRNVTVDEVPDAAIEKPTDALVRITTTNICGSDLHMYEGRTDVEQGKILGHENMGEVIAVGAGVDRVKVGDMVCLPFNIGCGFCKNCEAGRTGFCLTVNPPNAGGAYGYADMGPYSGGQAELLRVPYADWNALVLPEDAREKENDYAMLSDILPTGYHGTELAQVGFGESVVVWGAGPVGLMAAISANLRGADQVFVVDRQPDRLRLAEKVGATAVDDSAGDAVQQILDATRGEGADKGVEAVGYQAHDAQGREVPGLTINSLIQAVRPTGRIGVVGVFVPEDPEAADGPAREGKFAFDFGTFFFKGQAIGSGQANVKQYNRQLRNLIHHDKLHPGVIVSHELTLDQAPEGYERFDNREDGWTKVVLHP